MENLDISDLPAPVARALRAVVETVRRELAAKPQPEPEPEPRKTPDEKVKLSVCEGRVIGNLSREEIYDDVR